MSAQSYKPVPVKKTRLQQRSYTHTVQLFVIYLELKGPIAGPAISVQLPELALVIKAVTKVCETLVATEVRIVFSAARRLPGGTVTTVGRR